MSARDTQFARSAMLVAQHLSKQVEFPNYFWGLTIPEWREEAAKIIAQYAYDLVHHVLENTDPHWLDALPTDEHVQRIPDITEWTDELQR